MIVKTMYMLEKRTFLNSDKTAVVPEDSPEAHHLLGPAGFRIPLSYAKRLGLLEGGDLDVNGSGEVGSRDPVEDETFGAMGEVVTEGEGETSETDEGSGEQDAEPVREQIVVPDDNPQLNATLTILGNAGIEQDELPRMLDADILAVDRISMGRLKLIREYFPPEDTDDGATVDS